MSLMMERRNWPRFFSAGWSGVGKASFKMLLGNLCKFLGSSWHLSAKGLFTSINFKLFTFPHPPFLLFISFTTSAKLNTIIPIIPNLKPLYNYDFCETVTVVISSLLSILVNIHKMEKNYRILFILAFHPQSYGIKSVIVRIL